MPTKRKTFAFNQEWSAAISFYINDKKKLHSLTFPELSHRLESLDIYVTPRNLANRINQGTLGATLFISVLSVMNEESIDLNEIQQRYNDEKK